MKQLCKVCTPGPGCPLFDAGSCPKQGATAAAPKKGRIKAQTEAAPKKGRIKAQTEAVPAVTVDVALTAGEPTEEGE